MSKVTLCKINCECEQGTMFKTTMRDEDGRLSVFALVRGTSEDCLQFNALVFQGLCSHCGKEMEYSIWLENLLEYREV